MTFQLEMDLATSLTIIQTILTAIQTLHQLRHMFSFSYYENELQRLLKTVDAIQSVLEDADAKRGALNRQQTHYIEELKDAVYDASDVIDEFVTLVKRKELNDASHKFSDKVKSSLSLLSHKLSGKLNDVIKKLEAIALNSSNWMFKVDYKPVKFVKPETSSFMSPSDTIIGRDEDLEKIVEILLDLDDVTISSLAIVGMGGLGKTAFAQLVYNDPRVTNVFQLKCWTCIADQDRWNVKDILGKILKDLKVDNAHNLTSLGQMQQEVSNKLRGKKYLLVLDDLWTERYHEWKELEKFLMVGESGSRIVITTRSQKTAQNVGGVRVHELQRLSDDESWCLFKRMAFRPDQRENHDKDLIILGKEIVKKCHNVPLVIRIVGSLLHGEPKPKWLSFLDKELANISKSDDTMNNILSLSYHQLESPLKSCFIYCAIFPKDFVIDKQQLIRLWMAQGYINVENEGDEYFRLLLQRCFFQDVIENDIGEIESFKMHDLLHDIAEHASGKEICRLNPDLIIVDNKVRHLTILDDLCLQKTFHRTHIRTLFGGWATSQKLLAGNSIRDWKCLRSLDMSCFLGFSLPESIGKLLHLRYLNLSRSSDLEVLPNSITKLVNLQTLDLSECTSLIKLPDDLYKLVNLQTLDVSRCRKVIELPETIYKLVDLSTLDISGFLPLSHMPSNLGMLTNLHTLGRFIVGGRSLSKKQCLDGLKDLRSLNNLKGSLDIHIKVNVENEKYNQGDHGGGAYLIHKKHLRRITISSFSRMLNDESKEWEKSLWEDMQPPADIKYLFLWFYKGEVMPRWPRREDNSTLFYFPNLVKLDISLCRNLRVLPPLEKLPHLKTLRLFGLDNIEYILNVNLLEVLSLGEGSSFFPCLELLSTNGFPKLKGWWPESEEQNEPFPCFPKLKHLFISSCDMLKFIPICSSLISVKLDNSESVLMGWLPQSYQSLLPSDSKLRFITISDFEALKHR